MISSGSSKTRPENGAAETADRNVLLVGESRGLLTWATVLDRKEIRIKAARTGVEGRQALDSGRFHAAIALSPLPDLPIGAFVEESIRSRSENLRGVLVVIAENDDPPTLPLGERIRVHCCQSGDSQGVEEAIVDILDLETRVSARLEIHLEVQIGSGKTAIPGLTQNISEGGILIETGAPLLPGVRSHVQVELPGSEQAWVEGEVEVVRHRKRTGEPASSVAVRFVGLEEDHAYRWKRFLREQA